MKKFALAALLAADCSPSAHEGTVYPDGFGAVTPPTSPVPEASNVAMLLGGLGRFGFLARRPRAAAVPVWAMQGMSRRKASVRGQ